MFGPSPGNTMSRGTLARFVCAVALTLGLVITAIAASKSAGPAARPGPLAASYVTAW